MTAIKSQDLNFVNFNGPNLKKQEKHESQAWLTVGQVIVYNTKKRSKESGMQTRHSLESKPHPLPIYIGLQIHGLTRSKHLIQQIHPLWMCISYHYRVMQLEEWIATAICEHFKDDGVVSLACQHKGLFTVGALDTLDHNPTSTTSQSSFHGTGIRNLQFPTENKDGESRSPVVIASSLSRKHILPERYSTVPAVATISSTVSVLKCDMKPARKGLDQAIEDETKWVEN